MTLEWPRQPDSPGAPSFPPAAGCAGRAHVRHPSTPTEALLVGDASLPRSSWLSSGTWVPDGRLIATAPAGSAKWADIHALEPCRALWIAGEVGWAWRRRDRRGGTGEPVGRPVADGAVQIARGEALRAASRWAGP